MTTSILIILISILIVVIIGSTGLILYKFKNAGNSNQNNLIMDLANRVEYITKNHSDQLNSINEMQISTLKNYNENVVTFLKSNSDMQKSNLIEIQKRLDDILKNNEEKLTVATESIRKGLTNIQESNEMKLEKMRETVDEKLNSSLNKRLNESFSLISDRLENVYKGLGEMQALANGVGDLKKVLSNVKSRGVFGEVSLGNILEQILTSDQFEKNVAIKSDSQQRVDFAVKLPGKNRETIWLPIDAKFPMDDYQRLCETSELADKEKVEISLKELYKAVEKQAKSISDKYIYIPETTDFALMYLATEGLYSEIVKKAGMVELLQRKYKIIVCGPTTLTALLNSLQIGFRTLQIEKRSSEIWKTLGMFKREFETFTGLLAKTQKQLDTVSNTLESASKRSNIITKKLNKVDIEDDDQLPTKISVLPIANDE